MNPMRSFQWKVEIPVIAVLITLCCLSIVRSQQDARNQRRSVEVQRAAIAVALAVERTAIGDKGSYRRFTKDADGALEAAGYHQDPDVDVHLSATNDRYCVAVRDDRIRDVWRSASLAMGQVLRPGGECT